MVFLDTISIELIVKSTLALFLGFCLGLEREYRAKPAGVKTYALICLGSTIITYCSIYFQSAEDPSRLAAQIVSGLGFIGAGTIFQSRNVITGLTTAASLWVVGGIGILIGLGYYVESMLTMVLIYLYFLMTKFIQSKRFRRFKYSTSLTLKKGEDLAFFDALIQKYQLDIIKKTIFKIKTIQVDITYLGKEKQNQKFINECLAHSAIKEIKH